MSSKKLQENEVAGRETVPLLCNFRKKAILGETPV